MFRSLRLVALAAIAITVAACGSSEPEEEIVTDPPPTFSIASQEFTCSQGQACLVFTAIASQNVELTEVVIRNPRAQSIRFNAGNVAFLSGSPIALQSGDDAYNRVSGNWSFQFLGRRSGGTQAAFDVTTPLSVGALQEDIPEGEKIQ